MMGFSLDNYEQVKDRITRFYADHPDGSITTELVNDPSSVTSFATFKATVSIAGTVKATGYAMEQQGQGVNKDAWVENAETSAIGRALANMDYCGTMRPSREEMSKVGGSDREYAELKTALIDYIAAGAFEHPENVEKVIAEKNIQMMRRALEHAKVKP
jgi:hypothetical protein